jgi:MarR family 2-MHQ and catechol resistance regulon transcriptional repressor
MLQSKRKGRKGLIAEWYNERRTAYLTHIPITGFIRTPSTNMGSHYAGTEEELRALNTFIKLVRATETVILSTSAHLAQSPVTPTQFGVLEALYHLGSMRLCDLAAKHLKTSGTLTIVVDNLAKIGLVERRPSPTDRRSIIVHLTDAGRSTIAGLLPAHVRGVAEAMSALTADEQIELGRLCKKLGLGEAK